MGQRKRSATARDRSRRFSESFWTLLHVDDHAGAMKVKLERAKKREKTGKKRERLSFSALRSTAMACHADSPASTEIKSDVGEGPDSVQLFAGRSFCDSKKDLVKKGILVLKKRASLAFDQNGTVCRAFHLLRACPFRASGLSALSCSAFECSKPLVGACFPSLASRFAEKLVLIVRLVLDASLNSRRHRVRPSITPPSN